MVTYGIIGIMVPVLQMMMNVYFHVYRDLYKDLIEKSKQVEWFPMFFVLPITGMSDLVHSKDLAAGDYTPRAHFYLSRYNSLCLLVVLVLLLTFGVAYPPLALILVFNMALTTLAFQLTLYIHSKQIVYLPPECFVVWLTICEDEIANMHKIIYGSRTVIYMFAAFFACFAIYDITALDSYVGALVLMGLLIVLSFVSVQLMYILRDLRAEADRVQNALGDSHAYGSMELAQVGASAAGSGDGDKVTTINPILVAKSASEETNKKNEV